MRGLLFLCSVGFLALVLVACSPVVESSEGDANAAVLQLGLRYQQALEHPDPRDQLKIYRDLQRELAAVVTEHPRASVSLRILGDEPVAGLSRSVLQQRIAEARRAAGLQEEESQQQDANMMALAAGQAYNSALRDDDLSSKINSLDSVSNLLDDIISRHPESEIARRIVGGTEVAGVTRAALSEQISQTRQEILWQADYGDLSSNLDYVLTAASDHGTDLDGLDRLCVKRIFAESLDLEEAIGIRLIIDRQLGRHHSYASRLVPFLEARYDVKSSAEALADLYQPRLFAAFGRAAEDCHLNR